MSVIDTNIRHRKERIGFIGYNTFGTPMKIIDYKTSKNIIVEFQDSYKCVVESCYKCFVSGNIKNPYDKTLYGIGYIGEGHRLKYNNKFTKEARTWLSMLERCYSDQYKNNKHTYDDVCCCDEWLCYQNFYNWLHSQENFFQWVNLPQSAIDKDILIKGNKIYSPETCCLVSKKINSLFTKADSKRGQYPIGVIFNKNHNCFEVQIQNQITGKRNYYTKFKSANEAFEVYKVEKEKIIKQVAQQEFEAGNITKKCYDAMIRYEVEITD